MITVKLPDGSSKSLEDGATALDLAKSISQGLARETLAARVNDETWDATRPLPDGAVVKLLTWNDKEGKHAFWHSSAHLMAEALEGLYPGVKFWVGPALDQGFYYDVDFGGRPFSAEDFAKVEAKMKEIAGGSHPYVRTKVAKAEALETFKNKGDMYKVDLITGFDDGTITFYKQNGFTDLCRGPHLPHTGFIKAVKLLSVAGAYWKGDEKNAQLTRIYGITFPKQKELDDYLVAQEEAKKRDHRKIGKDLGLFAFDDDVGQGLPLWLPRGAILIEELEKLAKETEFMAGYQRVRTPHLAKESMYKTSGHLPYYAESMFPPMEVKEEGGETTTRYYLKSMNCPHHHKIFAAEKRSYRDLPLRLAEYGTCYRYEQSGELMGLMRVRSLQMNDAHIYCTPEQFADEFRAVNQMYLDYFKLFGLGEYQMRLSTHDPKRLGEKYVDEPELWIKTEAMVRDVMKASGVRFEEVANEAAFYGPKIDVQVYSISGREFTLATNQVDFAVPRRFGLTYTAAGGAEETPLCIHRAPLGTHERFLAFLIEHYGGRFPLWLSPVQVRLLPVSESQAAGAKALETRLRGMGIRAECDTRGESLGKRVRDAQLEKVGLIVTLGQRELDEKTASVRLPSGDQVNGIPMERFITQLKAGLDGRLADVVFTPS